MLSSYRASIRTSYRIPQSCPWSTAVLILIQFRWPPHHPMPTNDKSRYHHIITALEDLDCCHHHPAWPAIHPRGHLSARLRKISGQLAQQPTSRRSRTCRSNAKRPTCASTSNSTGRSTEWSSTKATTATPIASMSDPVRGSSAPLSMFTSTLAAWPLPPIRYVIASLLRCFSFLSLSLSVFVGCCWLWSSLTGWHFCWKHHHYPVWSARPGSLGSGPPPSLYLVGR